MPREGGIHLSKGKKYGGKTKFVVDYLYVHRDKSIPSSAFADPIGRRFPMMDKHHLLSALCAAVWRYNHLRGLNEKEREETIEYLTKVHDRILERAKGWRMKLHHDCDMCFHKEKVEFT
jgi:hypothetical protein